MKFRIKNFKTHLDVSLDAGSVNVFIGGNGSGKSAALEAIGVLGAAVAARVDDSSLMYRGVRLGTPALYKSSFSSEKRLPLNIDLSASWKQSDSNWVYEVKLGNPIDEPQPSWTFNSETLSMNNKKIFSRTKDVSFHLENLANVKIDQYRSLLSFLQGIESFNTTKDFYNMLSDYCIYTPSTVMLRGVYPDPTQREPIGLLGGRLGDAVNDLLNINDGMFGTMDTEDLTEAIDWVDSIIIGKPTKSMISASTPQMFRTILFNDRYMKENRNQLSSSDVSEGALYVLFVLSLALHKKTPMMFAIDNFDQALNPRLARKTTSLFCEQIIQNGKVAFLTTHNPLVLDGLNLLDDRIRLFAFDRTLNGQTQITRIEVTEKLLQESKDNIPLSRLWVMGRFGGVPSL